MNYYYGGKYIIVHTINNSFNCPTIYRDTVDLPAPPVVSMSTADSFACYGTDITMKANVLNGKPNYSYKWDRYTYDYDTTKQTITVKNPTFVAGDTFQSLKFTNFQKDTVIRVEVTDGDGCVFYDTAAILVKPLPILSLGPDPRICTYENFTFDAQNADTVDYYWNTGDTTQTINVHIEKDYSVTVVERTWLCEEKDTVHLYVNDTAIALAGLDTTICHQQSANLIGGHKPSKESAVYEWTDLGASKKLGTKKDYVVSPRNTNSNGGSLQSYNYEIYVKVTQGGHTCENYDTVTVNVNTLPVVQWLKKPLPSECFDYGDIELNSFLNVGKTNGVQIWGGTLKREIIW